MAQYKSNIVDINLNTGNIHRTFLNHSIGQKDDDADRFGIRAFRDGVQQDLSGCSCHAWFTNSQGTTLALTEYGTVDGNEAYVTLPPACYDYDGQFCLAIKLVGGGISSTVRIVDGMVDNIDVGGAVSPTSEIPDYSDILAQYDAMVAATSAANTAIAETFDATKAYPAGKYVINSGALYRLTADHAANVTWANTSKVAAKFGDDLSDLKSAVNHRIDLEILSNLSRKKVYNFVDLSEATWERKLVSAQGVVTDNYTKAILSSEITIPENTQIIRYAGEEYHPSGTKYTCYICFYTSNSTFISRSVAFSLEQYYDLSIPTNATKYRVLLLVPSSSSTTVLTNRAADVRIEYQNILDGLTEEVNALQDDVDNLYVIANIQGTSFSWSRGGISEEGTATGGTNFIRTGYIKRPETKVITYTGKMKDDDDDNYSVYAAQYDSEYNFIERAGFRVTPLQLNINCKYIRYAFGYPLSLGKDITTSAASEFSIQYTTSRDSVIEEEMEKFVDETEQIQNKVNLPIENRYGQRGQTLYTFGDGSTYWDDPAVPPESELTEIISEWLEEHPQVLGNESNRAYQNVYAMQDDSTITAGMVCRTFGFRTPGDGGAGQYIISSTGTANGMDVIELENGLFATLVIGKVINIKSLGAYGDGTHDDSETMVYAVSLLSDGKAIFFPSGIYIHGDGETGENGTGNSYTPTGSGNSYYHDSEHPVDIGRDIRLKIGNLDNIAIYGEQGSIIRSNAGNGECRNNEIFSFTNCNEILLKNLVIDGNRANRGLYLTDSDYGGYNQRGNIRIIGCNRVIIDNVQSINSGMDGAYIGVSNIENVKTKSTNVYISRSNFENAHRNGLSIAGCEYVFVNETITSDAGKSGESYGGTNPKACVDIEADFTSQPNDCIFISGMKALGAAGTYSIWVSAHASNVYIDKTTIDKDTYTSGTDTTNINISTIDLS